MSWRTVIKSSVWVAGSFGIIQVLKLGSNIALSHLLDPAVFGIMVIVYSVRAGIDLLTETGITQSVVTDPESAKTEFLDTAWTLKFIRGSFLWLICILLAQPIASYYAEPQLSWILPVAGSYFAVSGASSLAIAVLQKNLKSAALSIFELACEVVTAIGQVAFALFSPTVGALLFGSVLAVATRTVGSYFLVPHVRHKFLLSPVYAKRIFHFGFWIFVSSLVYYLSSFFDRLYLGRTVTFEFLGVYGIARGLVEVVNSLVTRLNFLVIFPYISLHSDRSRIELKAQINNLRVTFLFGCALGIAVLVSFSDLLVTFLYDRRYTQAGPILAVLSAGIWFSVLSGVNESILLGLGKPRFGAVANFAKFIWLALGIPGAAMIAGVTGIVVVVAASDMFRYPPIYYGQRQERFAFALQDLGATVFFFGMIGIVEYVRWTTGLGISFSY